MCSSDLSTLGAVSTLGEVRLGLGQRCKRKDLHLEGGRQHRAWARGGRVKPLNFRQGSFIFVGKTIFHQQYADHPVSPPLFSYDLIYYSIPYFLHIYKGRDVYKRQPRKNAS